MTSIPTNQVHWFYRKNEATDDEWQPFSRCDSNRLEDVYQKTSNQLDEGRFQSDTNHRLASNLHNDSEGESNNQTDSNGVEPIVSTNGGRYDVYLNSRCRKAIYWSESDSLVLRATWFYRPGSRMSYKPFDEETASILEITYQECLQTGIWNRKIFTTAGDTIVFHNAKVFAHYEADHAPYTDDWSNITDNLTKPGKVWRGVQDLNFEEGEADAIDHLVFVVHGIGEICDLRCRNLIEVVDDFRRLTNSLVKTHLFEEVKNLLRIEFIPISWHSALHGDDTGIDNRLNLITLNSIPKMRHFSNDTILDALFYTSPVYCQIIIDTVANELNRVHNLFLKRNPSFNGTINLMGHSLGSLIIFDILSNQKTNSADLQEEVQTFPDKSLKTDNTLQYQSLDEIFDHLDLTEYVDRFKSEKIDSITLFNLNETHLIQLGLEMGPRVKLLKFITDNSVNQCLEKLQTQREMISDQSIKYPQLSFNTKCFFALGSPIAAFLTVRGITSLSNDDLGLPTCDQIFNIFHPFDPIAYRMEPLIDEHFHSIPPCQIPHHKGRKRMHLELKENLIKMGTDLKEKVYNSLKPVWDSLYGLKRVRSITSFTDNQEPSPTPSTSSNAKEADFESDLGTTDDEESKLDDENKIIDLSNLDHPCYKFNSTGRVDYVLQEAPIEFFNGYIFALATHTCYWQSEDTALFVLRNIYKNAPQS
ncbi:phospholipase DDHD2-like [Tetranychus urticae]|uniref:DDHD domain-containing protein n=1 Tax=Tetranychus urticae TaxID=32264 RepID=T1JPM3_TETUR|nr:phospholipase DDHD2-like [Tetranychus urticae]